MGYGTENENIQIAEMVGDDQTFRRRLALKSNPQPQGFQNAG